VQIQICFPTGGLKVLEMNGNVISKFLKRLIRTTSCSKLGCIETMQGQYKRIASGLICNALNEGSRLPVGYDSRLSARPGVRPLIVVANRDGVKFVARVTGRSGLGLHPSEELTL
jgi:hypothetical protein